MVKIKEMPFAEKYAHVLEYTKLLETFVPPLLRKRPGDKAIMELKSRWDKAVQPIPDGASDETKYEIAYHNWIRQWEGALNLVRAELGEEGVEEFTRADVDTLSKENSGPALLLLKVMQTLSPNFAFSLTAKQMAYQLQWFTPFTVPELTGKKAVLHVPSCKILDSPEGEVACKVGCQGIIPIWLAEQFKMKYETDRKDKSCTVTLTPLQPELSIVSSRFGRSNSVAPLMADATISPRSWNVCARTIQYIHTQRPHAMANAK